MRHRRLDKYRGIDKARTARWLYVRDQGRHDAMTEQVESLKRGHADAVRDGSRRRRDVQRRIRTCRS